MVAYIRIPSFLRLNNVLLYYATFSLIQLSIHGHLGCLHLLTIVNSASTNMGVQISLQDPAFNSFEYIPEVELLDHMVIRFLMAYCFPQHLHHFVFESEILFKIFSESLRCNRIPEVKYNGNCSSEIQAASVR